MSILNSNNGALNTAVQNATKANASSLVSAGTAKTEASRTTLGANFNSFLTLLTTQLQNQDPTSPMKTHEFTNQLVMFAEAEQAIATNSKLDSLIAIGQKNEASQALNYYGKEVRVKGNKLSFMGDPVKFQYTSPAKVASGEFTVHDSTGKVVLNKKLSAGQLSEGVQNLSWDGRNAFGYTLPKGLYTVSVSAKDALGNAITIPDMSVTSSVRGVEYIDGKTWLDMGYYKVTMDNIASITTPGFRMEDQVQAMNFVGSNVHITGSTAKIINGALSVSFDTAGVKGFENSLSGETLKEVKLQLFDSTGILKKTVDISSLMDSTKLQSGEKHLNLKIPSLTDGDYQVKMDVQFTAADGTDGSKFIDIPTGYSGKVRRVVFQNGDIKLEINGVLYSPNDLGSVVSSEVPIFKL